MKNRKGTGKLPDPVEGFILTIKDSGYVDGEYAYQDKDSELPIRWSKNYSSLWVTSVEGTWELTEVTQKVIWVNGREYSLPEATEDHILLFFDVDRQERPANIATCHENKWFCRHMGFLQQWRMEKWALVKISI